MLTVVKVFVLFILFVSVGVSQAHAAEASVTSELTKKVIHEFMEIAKFPRPSGQEKAVSDHIVRWAKARNFKVEQDAFNNVIIDKPAAKGYENRPLIALQSHLDMVCVSNDRKYDPKKDPIIVINDGKTLKAKGTSLGADGAIGLAMALAVLDSDIPTGALRLIATTQEEVGLLGAKKLNIKQLDGVEYIINLDSEQSDRATVGCAGSVRITAVRKAHMVAPTLQQAISISAFDYLGGHSGSDIMYHRGNPIKTLAHILSVYTKNRIKFEVVSFEGGVAANVIPMSCTVQIVVEDKEKAITLANDFHKKLAKAHQTTDPNIKLEVKAADKPTAVFAQEDSQAFLDYLVATHSGLIAMAQDMQDIPSISTNIGLVRANEKTISIETMGRSLFASYVDQLKTAAESTAKMTGLSIAASTGYYPWEINKNSKLAKVIAEVYHKQNKRALILTATPGGLECAAFLATKPNIDAISIGPDVFNAHSVDEYVEIKSINTTMSLLIETLNSIAGPFSAS